MRRVSGLCSCWQWEGKVTVETVIPAGIHERVMGPEGTKFVEGDFEHVEVGNLKT
jgi:hypothetical protein